LTTAVTVNLTSDTLATHTNRTVKTFVSGTFGNFENVTGGSAGDKITGNATNNNLEGKGGDDSITGNARDDSLSGGPGKDSLVGNEGNDILDGGEGNDIAIGGVGNDTYLFASAAAAQTDSVSELANQGIDRLDFAALTTAVTIDLTK